MASVSNTINYTLCFKGVASSVEELPSYNNYIGDYFVVENNVGFAFTHYLTFVWTGKNWMQFEATEEYMKPYNELKSKSFDIPLKEVYDKDFESNLKKLEEKTHELELREKYYNGNKAIDKKELLTELASKISPRYIDATNWIQHINQDFDGYTLTNSIGDCIDDIYNQSNLKITSEGYVR